MGKRLSYPTANVPTNNSGEILWEEGVTSSKDGPVVKFRCALGDRCLLNGTPGIVQARRALEQGQEFRALHAKCYQAAKRLPDAEKFVTVYRPFLTGEIVLPKGTTLLLDERGETVREVGIKCRKCFDPEKPNVIKYLDYSNLTRYVKVCLFRAAALACTIQTEDKTGWFRIWPMLGWLFFWDELCSECVIERGSTRKFREDKQSKKSKTVTLFKTLIVDGMVGTVYETCKCLYFTTEQSARNNWDQRIEICKYHKDDYRALRDRLAFLGPPETWNDKGEIVKPLPAQPQNSNVQKIGGAENGRPGRTPAFTTPQAWEAIDSLSKVDNSKLARAISKIVGQKVEPKQIRYWITQKMHCSSLTEVLESRTKLEQKEGEIR